MTAGLTGLPTGFTVSTVTRLLAAVEATVELIAADQGAFVLHILHGCRKKRKHHHKSWCNKHEICTN